MLTGKIMKIMLAVCMFGSTAWAADQQEVTLHGEIREFVEGDIYKIADEAGRVFRVDLGRYSGRLLNRTPFEVRGTMKEAKEGAILVADYMDYRDPDPFKEYFEALRGKDKSNDGGLKLEQIRDKAFDHENPVSDNPIFYQNNVKKLQRADLDKYQMMDVRELSDKPKGARVAFTGRAINTIIDQEVMNFWDIKGDPVIVHMNGAYCSLGQRCLIYGVWKQGEEGDYIDLEYMESVDLPG